MLGELRISEFSGRFILRTSVISAALSAMVRLE